MTAISLTRGDAGDAGAPLPRRRHGRAALAAIGGGLAVLVPIVFLSTFITYSLGALSNSNPAATILGQVAATPGLLLVISVVVIVVNLVVNATLNWLYRTGGGVGT